MPKNRPWERLLTQKIKSQTLDALYTCATLATTLAFRGLRKRLSNPLPGNPTIKGAKTKMPHLAGKCLGRCWMVLCPPPQARQDNAELSQDI